MSELRKPLLMSVSDRPYGHDRLYAAWNGWRWSLWALRLGGPMAALRRLWSAYALGHACETCQRCGREYLLWHADDELYGRVTGMWPEPWDDGSGRTELAGGLFCLGCFDQMAEERGISLRWTPKEIER